MLGGAQLLELLALVPTPLAKPVMLATQPSQEPRSVLVAQLASTPQTIPAPLLSSAEPPTVLHVNQGSRTLSRIWFTAKCVTPGKCRPQILQIAPNAKKALSAVMEPHSVRNARWEKPALQMGRAVARLAILVETVSVRVHQPALVGAIDAKLGIIERRMRAWNVTRKALHATQKV